jgi:hypothetical protein
LETLLTLFSLARAVRCAAAGVIEGVVSTASARFWDTEVLRTLPLELVTTTKSPPQTGRPAYVRL